MIGSDSISLLFRAKGDTSDAKKAFSDLKDSVAKDTKGIESSLEGAGSGASGLAGKLPAVAAAAAVAVAAIAALTSAAVTAGTKLFEIAKDASDFAGAIKDVTDKTGLSATTVSALSLAAQQAGSNLDQASGAVTKFAKLVGDAAEGSKTAADSLKRLGVDPKAALKDLDGALETVFKRIYDLKQSGDNVAAIKLAMEAFGKSGADLIPVIQQVNGNFGAFKRQAEAAGLTLNDLDTQIADDFGDTLTQFQYQLKVTATKFAIEYMPQITGAIKDLGNWLSRNKNEISEWGKWIAGVIGKVIAVFKELVDFYNNHQTALRVGLGIVTMGYSEGARIMANNIPDQPVTQPTAPDPQLTIIPQGSTDNGLTNYEAQRKQQEQAAKEREQRLKRQLEQLKQYNQQQVEAERQSYETAQRNLEFALDQKKITFDQYQAAVTENINRFSGRISELMLQGYQVAIKGKAGQELRNIQQQFAIDQQKFADEIEKQRQDLAKKTTDAEKKQSDERVKIAENEAKRKLEVRKSELALAIAQTEREFNFAYETQQWARATALAEQLFNYKQELAGKEIEFLKQIQKTKKKGSEEEQEILADIQKAQNEQQQQTLDNLDEWENSLKKIGERATEVREKVKQLREEIKNVMSPPNTSAGAPGDPGPADAGGGTGFFESFLNRFAEGITQYLTQIALVEDANGRLHFSFSKVFASIAELGLQAFAQLTQGFGEMLSNWVLYGDTGGMTLRKLSAQILANLASVAAQYALMCLAAAAFASTAFGAAMLGGTPGQFLAAAAIFGALALGAAVAGRALAGDSFKGNQATTGAASGAYGRQTRTGQGGQVYTSRPETQVIDTAINASAAIPAGGPHIVIESRGGLAFDELFKIRYQSNGDLRDVIRRDNRS